MRRGRPTAHARSDLDAGGLPLSAAEYAVRADQSAHIALLGIQAQGGCRAHTGRLAHGGQVPITDVALDRLEVAMAPGASHEWLLVAHTALGGERPVDLLARGEVERVLAQIEAELGAPETAPPAEGP